MGLIQPWGAINPITELQARWAVRVFKNELNLPSRKSMDEDIDRKIDQMAKRYVASPRHTVQVDHVDYCNEIADQIGCRPNLCKIDLNRCISTDLFLHLVHYLISDFRLGRLLLVGGFTPYRFRLEGPNTWDGAREAILTQYER